MLVEGEKIKTLDGTMSKPMLPFDDPERRISQNGELVLIMDCRRNSFLEKKEDRNINCYLSGDKRANEQIGLVTMHTDFYRLHNVIAKKLTTYNPHWLRRRDKIYNESRKLLGALLQKITYFDWLPELYNQSNTTRFLPEYTGYNSSITANVANVFATAAFRFGHTLINTKFYRLDENLAKSKYGHLPIHKSHFAPYHLHNYGGVDPILRGLIFTPGKDNSDLEDDFLVGTSGSHGHHGSFSKISAGQINTELTEKLFKMSELVSLDLAALNIQRGRDHALPFYYKWRELCGLSNHNILSDIPQLYHQILLEKYGDARNIDAFVGLILERKVSSYAKVGPTLSCLINRQFTEIRDGDRFYRSGFCKVLLPNL